MSTMISAGPARHSGWRDRVAITLDRSNNWARFRGMTRRLAASPAIWLVCATALSVALGRPAGAAEAITEFVIPTSGSGPGGITVGADGALYFVEVNANNLGRITPAGVITEFTIPSTANYSPVEVTTGPDGALWFTEYLGSKIGRMTVRIPVFTYTEFNTPTSGSYPAGITVGPDGALWFTESAGGKIGRITTAGVSTDSSTSAFNSRPIGITAGPDGGSPSMTLTRSGGSPPGVS